MTLVVKEETQKSLKGIRRRTSMVPRLETRVGREHSLVQEYLPLAYPERPKFFFAYLDTYDNITEQLGSHTIITSGKLPHVLKLMDFSAVNAKEGHWEREINTDGLIIQDLFQDASGTRRGYANLEKGVMDRFEPYGKNPSRYLMYSLQRSLVNAREFETFPFEQWDESLRELYKKMEPYFKIYDSSSFISPKVRAGYRLTFPCSSAI